MRYALATWLGLPLALGACGSDPGSSDDDVPPDAPVGTADKSGSLLIIEESIFGSNFTIEGGSFLDGTPGGTQRVDGPCTIRTGTVPPLPKVSAGTITLTGADAITLMPDAMTEYFAMQSDLHYAGGSSIGIAASGAGVPAFATSIVFPAPITVTQPSGFPVTVSKSGFSAAWTGAGPVSIQLVQKNVAIGCVFTGVTSATLPASTLSDLVVGTSNDDQVSITIGSTAQQSEVAGRFAVDVQALNAGLATMGFAQ